MAEAVITLEARKKMVRARAGEITLPKIVGMAIGTGGVDGCGNPVDPSSNDTRLKNEILRKEIDSYSFVDDTTCRYLCTLETNECIDEKINEIGLYDEDGDLVAIRTFKDKTKDDDLEMTFRVDDIF